MRRSTAAAVCTCVAFACLSGHRRHAVAASDALRLPALTTFAAPAVLPAESLPFDISAAFRMRIAADGSTADIDVLRIKAADRDVAIAVPAATVSEVKRVAVDALRRWRYVEMAADTYVRVSFTLRRPRDSGRPLAGRTIGVEPCLPAADLWKPPIVPFSARVGRLQQLEDVRIAEGPERVHEAVRTLLAQWRFANVAEGMRVESLVRFFPLDCGGTGG
jgi:hypothetical protein